MKKNLFRFSALCLLLAGCSDVAVDDTPVAGDEARKVVLNGECLTKTSLGAEEDGTRPVLWKAGDLLGLYVQEDGTALSGHQNILARLTDGEGRGPGYSDGSFETAIELSASKTYTLGIYYPYVQNAGTADEISHSIPAHQTQSAVAESRHWGMSGSFAYATAQFTTPSNLDLYDTPVVDFYLSHKTSTMWLKVTAATEDLAGWKVKGVSVTATENLAGDVTYKPATDEFTLASEGASKTVSLAVPGGAVLSTSEATELYLVTFPAALAGKQITLRYTLENADASAVKTLSHVRTLSAESTAMAGGCIHRFSEALPAADAEGWTYSTGAFDLSADGTANCYIVSTPGTYSFDATVIGNGAKGIMLPTGTTHFHTEKATIAPTQASLVWQTAKGLITSVSYADGKITFTKSADVEYGNALIAAKDADGTILWSWHIWCTETGDLQTYVSATGTYETMDRNLGATYASTEAITDETLRTRTLGMFYEWGRKDPFVGPAVLNSNSASGNQVAIYMTDNATLYDVENAEVTRPSAVSGSSTRNPTSIQWSIKNPMCFVYASDKWGRDWYTDSGTTDKYGPANRGYSFWGNPEGYNYESSSKPTPVKTIYDPCPVGYMLPPADAYSSMKQVEASSYGIVMSTDGGTTNTWFPFSSAIQGKYDNNTSDKFGKWIGDGICYMWMTTYTKESSYSVWNLRLYRGMLDTKNTLYKSNGLNVRCIQEIQ